MKIMICGKGGCGKSTVATLLSKRMNEMDYQVLLVDADESNLGVGRLMGASDPEALMDGLGGKKDLQQKMMASYTQGTPLKLFEGKWAISDIPENCLADADGIKYMAIGKIHHFEEGCACPMGGLAKNFLINLGTGPDEVVVVDAEAGVEHFGRGVEAGCDMVLAVVDPSFESFLLCEKIEALSAKAGKPCYFILNKTDERVAQAMTSRVNPEKTIAALPLNEAIFLDSLDGRPVTQGIPEIDRVAQFIQTAKQG